MGAIPRGASSGVDEGNGGEGDMNQKQIDEINKYLPENGKIFWNPRHGWTSNLWIDLSRQGFRTTTSPSGYVTVYDKDGAQFVQGCGRVQMLSALSAAMR